jgi:hypothetical protein
MKKTILFFLIIAFNCFGLFAQQTSEPICKMTLDEIALAQPFHRDHPKQEETESIANTLISEISVIYKLINTNELAKIKEHRNTVRLAVAQAIAIGMNYSMFKEDIDFIDAIKD